MAASNFTRRDFLTLAAAATALDLCLSPGAHATARTLPPLSISVICVNYFSNFRQQTDLAMVGR